MFMYLLGITIIALLVLILIRKKPFFINSEVASKDVSNPSNQLTTDFLQQLNHLLQKQQTHQEQLIQSQLMNLFRVPKLRGIQGEKWLESQLKEVLPNQLYSIQHIFETGSICDAVIFLPNGKKVPIDSKFSFENFRKMSDVANEDEYKEIENEFHKDIKLRINEISNKYILPHEGTIDFALMFIPAESIFYQTFVEKDHLREYAFQKKVIVTSPSTLYIYLQFIKYGFDGHQIQKNIKVIQQSLSGIKNDLDLFAEEYEKLKDKLDQAQKNFDRSSKYFDKAQNSLKGLTELTLPEDTNTMELL